MEHEGKGIGFTQLYFRLVGEEHVEWKILEK